MHRSRFPNVSCERARAWASLELDGELSEVEEALLEDHVRRCSACAEARDRLHRVTDLLRSAPLEHPTAPPGFRRSRGLASRRPALALRVAAAAAVAALAAGLGALATSLGTEAERPTPPSQPDIALLPSQDELRDDGLPRPLRTAPRERRF